MIHVDLSKRNSIFSLILVWIFLTSTAPFVFFRWPGHPYKTLSFLCLFTMVFHLNVGRGVKRVDSSIFAIVLLQICYYILISFYHSDFKNVNLCIQLISLCIIISYIKIYVGFDVFVKSFIWIMLIMGVGGTLTFFLHLLGLITPIFRVEYGSDISYFLGLTTTNVFFDSEGIRVIRYAGFFDEPGTFSLFSVFALILNKVYFNDKNKELLLILVTIFTFSIAFYVTIFFYFLFFYVTKKDMKYVPLIISVVFICYLSLQNSNGGSLGTIYKLTFERLDFSEDARGNNNRAGPMENDRRIFFNNFLLGVGLGSEEVEGSNVFAVFARYGVIGSFFFYAFLIYLLLLIVNVPLENRKLFFKIYIVILLTFFYRPELSSVMVLLVFYMLIDYIKSKKYLNCKN